MITMEFDDEMRELSDLFDEKYIKKLIYNFPDFNFVEKTECFQVLSNYIEQFPIVLNINSKLVSKARKHAEDALELANDVVLKESIPFHLAMELHNIATHFDNLMSHKKKDVNENIKVSR